MIPCIFRQSKLMKLIIPPRCPSSRGRHYCIGYFISKGNRHKPAVQRRTTPTRSREEGNSLPVWIILSFLILFPVTPARVLG